MFDTYNQTHYDAFHLGQGAYYHGKYADDNPYSLTNDPGLYHMWHDGWLYGKLTTIEDKVLYDFDDE